MKKLLFHAILVLVVVLPISTFAAGKVKNVNVVNEPTVHIGNNPEVTVNNDALNPASVIIENSSSEPIPVINYDSDASYPREPFFIEVFHSGSGGGIWIDDYTVPDDKILVIEAINVTATNFPCDFVSAFLTYILPPGVTAPGDSSVSKIITPLVDVDVCRGFDPPFQHMGASKITRFYAGPGYKIGVGQPGGSSSVRVGYSGYLLPADSPSLAP